MNKKQIEKAGFSGDPAELNNNMDKAVEVALNAIDKQGFDNFLKEHRGGESGLNGKIDTSNYENEITRLKDIFQNNKDLWNNSERINCDVPAI